MVEIDRRGVLGLAAAAAGFSSPAEARMTAPIAHEMKPLGFDPTSIKGLSEKLLTSHHQNNYGGAVRRLGAIQTELAQARATDIPGYRLNGLKREELIAHNSAALHELYFEGFSGADSPSKKLGAQIVADFGSLDAWRAEFAAMGKALAGGSGWAFLVWSARLGRLINSWSADHTMTMAASSALVALDMYEHAYAIDYGANAGAYVDAFIAAQRWSAASKIFGAVT